jgi:AraC-like DNA-binding protein
VFRSAPCPILVSLQSPGSPESRLTAIHDRPKLSTGSDRRIFLRPTSVPGSEVLIARDSFLPSHLYSERYGVFVYCKAAADRRDDSGNYFRDQNNSALLLQPYEVHTCTSAGERMDFKVLYIEPALVVWAARELGLSRFPHYRTAQSEDLLLLRAVWEFCAAVEERAPANEQQVRFETCLKHMLDAIDERSPSAGSAHHAVMRARDYLRHRFHETVTLDDLGAVSGLSRFHLLRSFAARVGLPPHAYQLRLRIERAMTLLRMGLAPSDVAGLVGFADQSHLTRHFRRLLQVTPAQYARTTGSG